MLERGSRAEAGHLASDGKGPCGRPAPEARRGASASDPRGVPSRDGKRPAGTNPRADDLRARGLTAPAPARLAAWAQDFSRRSCGCGVRSASVGEWQEDGKGLATCGSETAAVAGATAHHRASASDEAARRGGGADPPLIAPAGYGKTTLAREWLAQRGKTRSVVPRTDRCFGRRSCRSFAVQGACANLVDDRAEHARVAGRAHNSGGGTRRDRGPDGGRVGRLAGGHVAGDGRVRARRAACGAGEARRALRAGLRRPRVDHRARSSELDRAARSAVRRRVRTAGGVAGNDARRSVSGARERDACAGRPSGARRRLARGHRPRRVASRRGKSDNGRAVSALRLRRAGTVRQARSGRTAAPRSSVDAVGADAESSFSLLPETPRSASWRPRSMLASSLCARDKTWRSIRCAARSSSRRSGTSASAKTRSTLWRCGCSPRLSGTMHSSSLAGLI